MGRGDVGGVRSGVMWVGMTWEGSEVDDVGGVRSGVMWVGMTWEGSEVG